MLAACLLIGLLALPPATVLLFSRVARRAGGPVSTLLVATGLAGIAVGVALALGTVLFYALTGAAVQIAGAAAWVPVARRWGAVGRAAWAVAVTTGALYLLYMLEWTFRSGLGPVGTAGGMLLWVLELAAYLLGLAYLWEMVDVLATSRWSRRVARPPGAAGPEDLPFVSLHVPAHNEPPGMVIETLSSLLALDYPSDRYEIVMIDDNTSDPDLWRPVADFSAAFPGRIRFHHLEDWPGFKSGALNFALTVTDPRAEVVGVVDADYLAQPDYLRRCAPLFVAEPELGFVQTPQDYRDWEQAAYYRRLYYSYSYFFAISQSSRNERDGAIFGGTMGLIRRRALEQVGGWDQWCITEDAELSLRLLRAGWSGRHVDASFGRGVMPLTFDALKRQRFRWCFGGIQILRMHWRSLLPWDRDPANKLSTAQRLAYLSGALQWYGDLLGLVFSAFLVVAVADMAAGGGVVFRRLSGFLLVAVPLLVGLNLIRAVALLRRATAASWRDALGAFGIWLALGWTVASASVRGALSPAGVFLRTPKTRGDAGWRDAISANRVEVFLVAAGIAAMASAVAATTGAARWLLPALLLVPVLGHLAAPFNTVAALRAELPDELRRRRRTERLRAWTSGSLRPGRVLIGATALISATTAVFLMIAPGGTPAPTPSLLNEASGHGPAPAPVPAVPAVRPAGTTGTQTEGPATPPGGAPARAPRTSRHRGAGTAGSTTTAAGATTARPAVVGHQVPSTTTTAVPVSVPAPPSSTTTTRAAGTVGPTATTGPPATTPAATTIPATATTRTTGPPSSTPGTTPTTRTTGPPSSTPGGPPTSRP